jgi:HEAT repeat protein
MQHLADEDPLVVNSAAWALAHLADDTAISALIKARSHADSSVRQAVAVGLAGSVRPEAIATLIELMEDEVRNWATFALGTQSAEDSPQIREALRNRLTDTFSDVRDEATWGLALRKDPIGVRMLLDRLESEPWIQGDKYAAADILGLPYSDDVPVPDLCSGLRQILTYLRGR